MQNFNDPAKIRILLIVLFCLFTLFMNTSKFNNSLSNLPLGDITLNETTSLLDGNVIENVTTILCLVMTRSSGNGKLLQDAIIDTWGSSCTDLIFLIGEKMTDDSILIEMKSHVYTLLLTVEDAWANTWMKIRTALKFVRNKWKRSFDWIIRIDDDAFVIFDNMWQMVATFDPSLPIQLGARYLQYAGGYIGTGSGLVISRAGFDNLMNVFDIHSLCNTNATTHADDVEIGVCLKNANVSYGNSSDSLGRPRFIPISLPDLLLNSEAPNHGFFKSYSAYPVKEGLDCCSDDLISLHYVSADDIRRFHRIVQMHPDKHRNLRLLTADLFKIVS